MSNYRRPTYGYDPYAQPPVRTVPRDYDPYPSPVEVYPVPRYQAAAPPTLPPSAGSGRRVEYRYYDPTDPHFQPPPRQVPPPVILPSPAQYVGAPAHTSKFLPGELYKVVAVENNEVSARRPMVDYHNPYDPYVPRGGGGGGGIRRVVHDPYYTG